MVARKRGRDEMEAEEPVEEPSMLHKLRNMWQFANLAQYLHLFIGALKIDHDFDIEVRIPRKRPSGPAQTAFDGARADIWPGFGDRVPQAPAV